VSLFSPALTVQTHTQKKTHTQGTRVNIPLALLQPKQSLHIPGCLDWRCNWWPVSRHEPLDITYHPTVAKANTNSREAVFPK